ncbi:hypothetical protein GU926_08220 [Nibribacter ruber]|uniref:Uncharacterized protein n=1 Tax=Nibribacter ruber TaxID=2698458 RepID=A0A6P1NZP9_9BACT|nr:hypothetical protein [Nibribacter ruber]QHL87421.1 hypothetical protein GU926_08220 [Nibribacter ruber]
MAKNNQPATEQTNKPAPEQAVKLTPEQEIALLKEQLAAKDAIIDEQLVALEDAEAAKGKVLPVVTHEGVQYQVNCAKFQHPEKDEDVTAAQLVADKELLSLLVEKKSGILSPVVKS